MLVSAIADFFKFKIVASVIILTCWPEYDQVRFSRQLSKHGIRATYSCNDTNTLYQNSRHQIQGVLYYAEHSELLQKVPSDHFSMWFKWLIVDNKPPSTLNEVRYDADITLLRANKTSGNKTTPSTVEKPNSYNFDDVYIHPAEGVSVHPWAVWTEKEKFTLKYERNRIIRRNDLRKFPLRISTPTNNYIESNYSGSFQEYLLDTSKPVPDSAVGCSYSGAQLLADALNATGVLSQVLLWTSKEDNRSMLWTLVTRQAELGGGVLRPLKERLDKLDYVMPIWPFRTGFTYLAERGSNGNMFVTPFSANVWWLCLFTGLGIALVQRLTARKDVEREGAIIGVLATFLQQDASAVPQGASGRCVFTVLSLWAMMIYAYYSSAIVSALMSAGLSGPQSLRELADSKYAIASEDYDYMRYMMFDRETNNSDLEYLKKKKKTANFYQTMQRGVELLRESYTAFHTEFNDIYLHFKTLSDDQVCKLSYIDTIPETLAWLVSPKHSQFSNVLRIAGSKIHERGLAKHSVGRWRTWPPECRAALLAERVTIGDVIPLLWISALGVVLALMFLALETLHAKWGKSLRGAKVTLVVDELQE